MLFGTTRLVQPIPTTIYIYVLSINRNKNMIMLDRELDCAIFFCTFNSIHISPSYESFLLHYALRLYRGIILSKLRLGDFISTAFGIVSSFLCEMYALLPYVSADIRLLCRLLPFIVLFATAAFSTH